MSRKAQAPAPEREPSFRRRRLPHAALLVLSTLLAGATIFLTWPSRVEVFCDELPQLTVLAACAATLVVFSIRALSVAGSAGEDRRIAGGSAILAALAFFLSAHFLAEYRKPCVEVQQRLHPEAALSADPTVRATHRKQ